MGTCLAEFAIDGSLNTFSRTQVKATPWWRVELEHMTTVNTIKVWLKWSAYKNSKYKKFEIKTKKEAGDDWTTCKGPYDVDLPIHPHVIKCLNANTKAKYLQLSLANDEDLLLKEVAVFGKIEEPTRSEKLVKRDVGYPYVFSGVVDEYQVGNMSTSEGVRRLQMKTLDAPLWENKVGIFVNF